MKLDVPDVQNNLSNKEVTTMANKDPDMKNISEVSNGFMVRKTIMGVQNQYFFGFKKYGNRDAALKAAKDARDQLLMETRHYRAVRSHHLHNTTGIIGLSWRCKQNPSQPQKIIHQFRVQAPDRYSRHNTGTSESIKDKGLWHAYKAAAEWRQNKTIAVNGKLSELFQKTELTRRASILNAFLCFLDFYLNELSQTTDKAIKNEMRVALSELLADPSTPVCIRLHVIDQLTNNTSQCA